MESLRVERMIIHLVGQQDQKFIPRDEIEVQQEGFFRARIPKRSRRWRAFLTDDSVVKPILERMAKQELGFAAGGQELARRFWDLHVRQSVSGAFFVLEMRSNVPETVLYALIKYDYREAVELADQGGKSILRAIVQAFVKERRAVQNSVWCGSPKVLLNQRCALRSNEGGS